MILRFLATCALALCLVPAPAEACVRSVRAANDFVARFDPFDPSPTRHVFALELRGEPGARVDFALVDRDDAARLGEGGPGPYRIDVVRDDQLAGSPTGANRSIVREGAPALAGPRGRALFDRDGSARVELALVIEGDRPDRILTARRGGVWERFDLVLQCGDGLVETRDGVALGVALESAVRARFVAAGDRSAELDLGELGLDAAASGVAMIGVRATGGFSLRFKGREAQWALRRSARGADPDRARIPLDVLFNGRAIAPGDTIACPAGGGAGALEVRTQSAAPGAGKIAGDYEEEIVIVVSPRDGAGSGEGCLR